MTGASIKATLELWASSLRDVKARMRPLFRQERVANSTGQFLDDLRMPGDARRQVIEPRMQDCMRAYLELADLDAGDFNMAFAGIWTRGLLIRHNIVDGDLAFFSTWCPVGTSMESW